MGGNVEVDGDLDGGPDDDGAEVGYDVVGGALGVVVPGGVADVVEVGVDRPVVDGAAGQLEPEAVAVGDGVGHLDRNLDVVGGVFVELHGVLEGGVVGEPQGHGHGVGGGRDGVDPLEGLQGDQGVVVQAVDGNVGGGYLEGVVDLVDLRRAHLTWMMNRRPATNF